MAIPHLQRVDAVLHDLGGYALHCAKEILHVGADVEGEVLEIMERDDQAIDAANARLKERYDAEWDATVGPLCSQLDDCASRIDAAAGNGSADMSCRELI